MSQNVNELNNGVLANLFSSRAIAQILDFFFDHKEFDYPPSEIAKKTGLSFRTIFREIPSLERNQLIFNNRRIGKTNMYKLNTDFEAVAFQLKPEIERAKAGLLKAGARAAMLAGSGSAVFGIFDNQDAQERAIQAIELEAGWRVFPCKTVGRDHYRSAMGPAGEILARLFG